MPARLQILVVKEEVSERFPRFPHLILKMFEDVALTHGLWLGQTDSLMTGRLDQTMETETLPGTAPVTAWILRMARIPSSLILRMARNPNSLHPRERDRPSSCDDSRQTEDRHSTGSSSCRCKICTIEGS